MRRTWLSALVVLCFAFGCRPAAPPGPARALQPTGETVARWEPLVVRELPRAVPPPWGGTWGDRVEVWRLDPLELDRPEVNSWLAEWGRGKKLAGRRLALAPPPGSAAVPISEPGAYALRARDGRAWRAALVIASPLTLALTLYDDDLEVFCAESRTGKPVRGAFARTVYRTTWRGRERVVTASGTTDASGRWHAAVVRDRFAPQVVATAIAAQGNNYALATARRVIEPEPPVRLVVRPRQEVVHPGQRGEVAGRLARLVSDRAVPVGNAAVKLWLLGPDGVPLETKVTRTSPVGQFGAVFQLPRDARPGAYAVAVAVEGTVRCWPRRFRAFEVVPLAPEPFRLKVTANTAVVAPGDELTIEVEATDAEGRPLRGTEIRTLSYGYPVALSERPRWLLGTEAVEPERVVVGPVGLAASQTDGQGKAGLRWRASRAELPERDLLCAVKVLADAGPLGTASRTVELVLLAEPALVSIAPPRRFARPGEAVELTFQTPLSPADQEKVGARCELSYDDEGLSRHRFTVFAGTVAGLAARKLKAALSQPGRYGFVVRAGRSASRSVVWVAAKGADIPWSGAGSPALVFARPWARAGEKLLAVVAGRSPGSPIALTLRKRSRVERRLVEAPGGARCIEVPLLPDDRGPLEARLAQVAGGRVGQGAARLPVEPGGRGLQVGTSLMWVRKGEWSGRGYRIRTTDPAGHAVQSVAALALVRPTFRGCPPAAVGASFVLSHEGKATSQAGELKVGFHEALLRRAAGMFVEALSPDGRRGALLGPLYIASPALGLPGGLERNPGERLAAIAEYGLEDPVARWLARCLVEAHPEAAEAVPRLIASARSGADAAALLRLAAASHRAAAASLAAALRSERIERAEAVAAVAADAPELRAALERLLKEDSSAAVRAAAARALSGVATRSLPTLGEALREDSAAEVRAAAAQALAGAGRQALAVLTATLARERVPQVCVAAARSLGRLGGEQALLGLLTRREASVVMAALGALEAAGCGGADPRLVRLLRSEDERIASLAARLVVRGGPEGIHRVVRAARGQPREGLVDALADADSPEVAAAMRRWVRQKDPAIRLAAGEWLARRGDELARGALREFLGETAPAERRERAAAALVAAKDVTSLPRLVALATKGKIGLGPTAALLRKAGQLGWQEAGPLAVEVLWRGLAHPEKLSEPRERELWVAAVGAAPWVGPLWSAQTEALVGTIPDDCPYREALAAFKRDGVGAFLAATWASPLPDDLRRHAVRAFARLEGKASAVRLIGLLDSPLFQEAALAALIEQGASGSLRDGLRNGSPVVRACCAAALGAIVDPASVPRLRPLLEDRDPFVRMEAAHALATITGEAVFYRDHLGEQRLATP